MLLVIEEVSSVANSCTTLYSVLNAMDQKKNLLIVQSVLGLVVYLEKKLWRFAKVCETIYNE